MKKLLLSVLCVLCCLSLCGCVETTEEDKKMDNEVMAQPENEFKEECKSYSYKEIFRNPDNYKGKKMKITGKVVQVIDGSDDYFQLRVNMTKDEYGYYDDTIFVQIGRDRFNGRILEDDVITFWGLNTGTKSYETVLGNETTIPAMKAYYATLVK